MYSDSALPSPACMLEEGKETHLYAHFELSAHLWLRADDEFKQTICSASRHGCKSGRNKDFNNSNKQQQANI